MPDFTIEVQAVGSPSPPEVSTTSQAVEISVTPAVVFEGGTESDKHDDYTQNIAATTWGPINHNLGKYPAVQAIDSAGSELNPGVIHNNENTVTLTFAAAASGTAFFN